MVIEILIPRLKYILYYLTEYKILFNYCIYMFHFRLKTVLFLFLFNNKKCNYLIFILIYILFFINLNNIQK